MGESLKGQILGIQRTQTEQEQSILARIVDLDKALSDSTENMQKALQAQADQERSVGARIAGLDAALAGIKDSVAALRCQHSPPVTGRRDVRTLLDESDGD